MCWELLYYKNPKWLPSWSSEVWYQCHSCLLEWFPPPPTSCHVLIIFSVPDLSIWPPFCHCTSVRETHMCRYHIIGPSNQMASPFHAPYVPFPFVQDRGFPSVHPSSFKQQQLRTQQNTGFQIHRVTQKIFNSPFPPVSVTKWQISHSIVLCVCLFFLADNLLLERIPYISWTASLFKSDSSIEVVTNPSHKMAPKHQDCRQTMPSWITAPGKLFK